MVVRDIRCIVCKGDNGMTPEAALGRLINLREQLTEVMGALGYAGLRRTVKRDLTPIYKDLDNIIRSIERDIAPKIEPDSKPSDESSYWEKGNPFVLDSEDMERRRKK